MRLSRSRCRSEIDGNTGRPMPDGTSGPGKVLTEGLNAKDGAEDTIKNRLEASGADKDLGSTPTSWEAGKTQGFSERTLRAANGELGILSRRDGNGHEHRA